VTSEGKGLQVVRIVGGNLERDGWAGRVYTKDGNHLAHVSRVEIQITPEGSRAKVELLHAEFDVSAQVEVVTVCPQCKKAGPVVVAHPPCENCGHRYDEHTDPGDPRRIGCHLCPCKEWETK
jgi:hypothetical protein